MLIFLVKLTAGSSDDMVPPDMVTNDIMKDQIRNVTCNLDKPMIPFLNVLCVNALSILYKYLPNYQCLKRLGKDFLQRIHFREAVQFILTMH